MKFKKLLKGSMLVALLGLMSCSAPKLLLDDGVTSLMDVEVVYTQTNLHPDIRRSRLSTVNFLQEGLIPRCTEVSVIDVGRKRFTFIASGVEYNLLKYGKTASFGDAILKYFGPTCSKDATNNFSAVDSKGLRQGRVLVGMSKEAVILAVGYPPEWATPDLSHYKWKYWVSKFNTIDVIFNTSGFVSSIVD